MGTSKVCFSFYMLLCLLRNSSAQIFAPKLTLHQDTVTYNAATVSYQSLLFVTSEDLVYDAQHNSADEDTGIITGVYPGTNITLTGLRSNINYIVRVVTRNVEHSNWDSIYSNAVTIRTAPNGSSIWNAITTPTFITVFLEQTPGSTAWQVEYTNVADGSTSILNVPDDTPDNTRYVAILLNLSPNTRYDVKARVAQINSVTDFSLEQSPFGTVTTIKTDKFSVFGRVTLAGGSSKTAIASALLSEFQTVATVDVDKVIIHSPDVFTGSPVTCYYELILNDQSTSIDVAALTNALGGTGYNNNDVRLNPGYSSFYSTGYHFGIDEPYLLYSDAQTSCTPKSYDIRMWELYDDKNMLTDTKYTFKSGGLTNLILELDFVDTGIRFSWSTRYVFRCTSNTIYGIRQNYLLRSCPKSDSTNTFYTRFYGAFLGWSKEPLVDMDQYTIFLTTGVTVLDTDSISSESTADESAAGCRLMLFIPSTFVYRAIYYELMFNGSIVATLNEADLDSSSSYNVVLPNMAVNSENSLDITASARGHNGSITSSSATFTVKIDIPIVMVDNVFSSSLLVSWNDIEGAIHFEINVAHEEVIIHHFYIASNNIPYVLVDGLLPGTLYSLDLCTKFLDGRSANSARIYQITVPGIVSGFDIYAATLTSISLRWEKSNGSLGYIITLRQTVVTGGRHQINPTRSFSVEGKTNVTISELTPRAEYDVTVKAYNNAGTGEKLSKKFTTSPHAPTELNMTSNGFCTIITWNPSVDASYYNVTIIEADSVMTVHVQPSPYAPTQLNMASNGTFSVITSTPTVASSYYNVTIIETKSVFTIHVLPNVLPDQQSLNRSCTYNVTVVACNKFGFCSDSKQALMLSDCQCDPGFMQADCACTDVNECASTTMNNCNDNANCSNTEGSYVCTCNHGYIGNGTFCEDINECNINSSNCHSNATCTNTEGGFVCSCKCGFVGNGSFCTDYNECDSNLHQQDCVYDYSCNNSTCSFFYCDGDVGCDDDNTDFVGNKTDLCGNYSSCTNNVGGYSCTCDAGCFMNDLWCNCGATMNNCDDNTNCSNTEDGYVQSCYVGNETFCEDINECNLNSSNCHSNATCTNTEGTGSSFVCSCKCGFVGNGTFCTDYNECGSYLHQQDCVYNYSCNNSTCSFFYCDGDVGCDDDYTDFVGNKTDPCGNYSSCTNNVGGYSCTCDAGYFMNGSTCYDIDECNGTVYPHNCSINSTCINTSGSFYCKCIDGFKIVGEDCLSCNNELPEQICQFENTCTPNTSCFPGSTGIPGSTALANYSFICHCAMERSNPCPGYTNTVNCWTNYCSFDNACSALSICELHTEGYQCRCLDESLVAMNLITGRRECVAPEFGWSWWWSWLWVSLIVLFAIFVVGVLFLMYAISSSEIKCRVLRI